jgi:hypothetical protein
MVQQGISKAALLDALKSGRDNLLGSLGPIPEADFERGAYENGWNGRQVLAHLAGIEWTYPNLIGIARESASGEQRAAKPPEKPNKSAQGGIGSYNDRTVERYANFTVGELISTFEENRARTIAAVEEADEDLFHVQVRSAGGIPGELGTVLNFVAVMHVNSHVNDIVAAAKG